MPAGQVNPNPGRQANPPQVTVNAYTLAGEYLDALGWPNTADTRRALAAWFMSESPHNSANGTVTVIGNNPLNIRNSPTRSGYWLAGGTTSIDTFASQADAIAAFKTRIGLNSYNYPGVVAAFQDANGQEIITAIINSGWVTGKPGSYNHYVATHGGGGHEENSLQQNYSALANSGDAGASAGADLGAWGNIVTFPVGHKLTQADVDSIMAKLEAAGYFNQSPAANLIAENTVRSTLESHIGEAWSKALEDELQQQFGQEATANGGGVDPFGIGAAISGAIHTVFGKAFAVGVVLAGVLMALFGLYLISKEATNGGSAESLVSPVPVFLREGA